MVPRYMRYEHCSSLGISRKSDEYKYIIMILPDYKPFLVPLVDGGI